MWFVYKKRQFKCSLFYNIYSESAVRQNFTTEDIDALELGPFYNNEELVLSLPAYNRPWFIKTLWPQ